MKIILKSHNDMNISIFKVVSSTGADLLRVLGGTGPTKKINDLFLLTLARFCYRISTFSRAKSSYNPTCSSGESSTNSCNADLYEFDSPRCQFQQLVL